MPTGSTTRSQRVPSILLSEAQHPLLLHGGAQLPEQLDEPAAVVRLHVMEPLILNQRHHLLQLLRRGTALDELTPERGTSPP